LARVNLLLFSKCSRTSRAMSRMTSRVMVLFSFLLVRKPQLVLSGRHFTLQDILQVDNKARAEENANTSSRSYWRLWGDEGPRMTDVEQGQLGNCYYLAGLAAIARWHPEIIKQVFVNGVRAPLSERFVYKLKFLVDGVETLVAVDEQVPTLRRKSAKTAGTFYFARATDQGAKAKVWPIILEKGFAKIFGSYLATRGGWGYDTFKAVTQAPVDVYSADFPGDGNTHVWTDPAALLTTLREAIRMKFPITGGTAENPFGVVDGHAFAIIGLDFHSDHGTTVEVYNPWAANRYNGSLKSLTTMSRGDYSMTFNEFTKAFRHVEVARVRKGYILSYTRVPTGKPMAFQFRMGGIGPFTVQLEWPTERFIDIHGCHLRHDRVKLLVSRVGDVNNWKHADLKYSRLTSNLHVDLQGPGEYLVYAYGSFDGAPWAEQIVINAYASEPITFFPLSDALAVGRQILGFQCKDLVYPTVTIGSMHLYEAYYRALPDPLGGSPAWELEVRYFGLPNVIWVDDRGRLTCAPSAKKLNRYYPGFDASRLKCLSEQRDEQARTEQESQKEEPESKENVVTSCEFALGEQVLFNHSGTQVCGDVEAVHEDSVSIRYLRTGRAAVGCQSERLTRVTQCTYQEGDLVRYLDHSFKWRDGQIVEVGCGTVTLSSNKTVRCDSLEMRYPEGCPFHKNEKVLIWSPAKGRWIFALAAEVNSEKVTVMYGGVTSGELMRMHITCSNRDKLKKASRCDKQAHEQIQRFGSLDNFEELVDGHPDSLFKPHVNSIGPPGADCGDSADGGPARPCGMFDTWAPISEVLH